VNTTQISVNATTLAVFSFIDGGWASPSIPLGMVIRSSHTSFQIVITLRRVFFRLLVCKLFFSLTFRDLGRR
jgi:hypothetical protein